MRNTARLRGGIIAREDPQVREATIRKGLFLRFDGHECDASTRDRILAAIEQAASQQSNGSCQYFLLLCCLSRLVFDLQGSVRKERCSLPWKLRLNGDVLGQCDLHRSSK